MAISLHTFRSLIFIMNEKYVEEYFTHIHINDLLFYIDTFG